VEIRFTKAARRHRVGRSSVRYVMAHTQPAPVTTAQGNAAWHYLGTDDRNRELEIIAVEVHAEAKRPAALLVIHVIPTHLRGG
jgi:hypothetical protein